MTTIKKTAYVPFDLAYFGGDTSNMLTRFGYEIVDVEKSADFVVLVGGTDIHPNMYGEEFNGAQASDRSIERDYYEQELFQHCQDTKKPILGICRGFQFLNVMNYGKLHQHIHGHTGNYGHHPVFSEDSELPEPEFYVNSFHHQQCILTPNTERRLWASQRHDELESCLWPKTRSAGVQWHPEWLSQAYPARAYFKELVEALFNEYG